MTDIAKQEQKNCLSDEEKGLIYRRTIRELKALEGEIPFLRVELNRLAANFDAAMQGDLERLSELVKKYNATDASCASKRADLKDLERHV
jgi:hypothetical protein